MLEASDRKSKAFSNRTANSSNLLPIKRQSEIAVGTLKTDTVK